MQKQSLISFIGHSSISVDMKFYCSKIRIKCLTLSLWDTITFQVNWETLTFITPMHQYQSPDIKTRVTGALWESQNFLIHCRSFSSAAFLCSLLMCTTVTCQQETFITVELNELITAFPRKSNDEITWQWHFCEVRLIV